MHHAIIHTCCFRIGAATSAESAEISELQIKTMDRWKSDAHCRYIKLTHAKLAIFLKLLLFRDIKHAVENSIHTQ